MNHGIMTLAEANRSFSSQATIYVPMLMLINLACRIDSMSCSIIAIPSLDKPQRKFQKNINICQFVKLSIHIPELVHPQDL